MWESASRPWRQAKLAKSQGEWEIEADKVVARLKEAGIEVPAGDFVAARLARELHVDPADTRKFASAVNRIQSTLMFRLDAADAAINVFGSMVKSGGEISYLMERRAKLSIEGQANFDAEMYRLFGTRIKDGSVPKLQVAKAFNEGFKDLYTAEGKVKLEERVRKGLMLENHVQLRDAFEDMRIDNSGLAARIDPDATLTKLGDAGRKVFSVVSKPSDWSNMAVQHAALNVADDLGRAAGLTGAELDSFMWTFNRRVNAITNPVHKPRLFQGALGISMSLYQSYTFHMLNNLFRYADKGAKAAPAMITALNGTFFGAQSVPGFQQLNQLVAERSEGNTDLYGAITKALGGELDARDASDFLLYGAGAAALQNNLYVRGDMNPRSATIVPTSLWDFPTVQATGRIIDSGVNAVTRITHGESWHPTIGDAVVGLGLNRPLRGIWEVAKGRSVDGNAATVAFHDDVWSLGTVTRALGMRPMSEGIVRDYQSRLYQIRSEQAATKKELGAHIRRMYDEKGAGILDDDEQMGDWMKMYQKANGTASNFSGFLETQVTKGQDDLSARLDKMVGRNASAIAQYRAMVGEADMWE